MRNFILRLIINAIAIAITAELLPGITVGGGLGTLLLVALIFGIVNAIVKPILMILTCPAVILTLGLFILILNALMLQLTSTIAGDAFTVADFGQAFLGGIVMGIAGIVLEAIIGEKKGDKPREVTG